MQLRPSVISYYFVIFRAANLGIGTLGEFTQGTPDLQIPSMVVPLKYPTPQGQE